MKLCLGTAQIGMKYGIANNVILEKNDSFQILDTALANNINYFDTAIKYGNAEETLGEYIRFKKLNNSDLKIITKIDSKSIIGNEEKIVLELNKSLNRLGLTSLEGLLYHDSDAVFNEKAMHILIDFKKLNLVKKVGVSVYTLEEAEHALSYNNVDIIQIPFNIFDSNSEKKEFINKASYLGVEIHVRSIFLQGLLTMSEDEIPTYLEKAKVYIKKLDEICNKYNYSRIKAAINYVKATKNINLVIFGVIDSMQLKETLHYFNEDINDEINNELNDAFTMIPKEIIDPRLWVKK
ncbi:MAG: aldo/keto reductase [Acholeplasma sp.]|nr:aldo/keto reductase [Acholeplasma sp.]